MRAQSRTRRGAFKWKVAGGRPTEFLAECQKWIPRVTETAICHRRGGGISTFLQSPGELRHFLHHHPIRLHFDEAE